MSEMLVIDKTVILKSYSPFIYGNKTHIHVFNRREHGSMKHDISYSMWYHVTFSKFCKLAAA